MNGRTMMLLALAIGFGLGAMFLTRQLLSDESTKKPEETMEVVVAGRDFKEEEVLKPDMVVMKAMVKSAIPAGAFSSIKDVEDRWVKSSLLEGDVLVEKKLGPKGAPPGLVANIPKGMRAFAIEVSEQTGVSGFVLPGHRVDVVHFDPGDKNNTKGETILQNVQVLAAGQTFTRPDERSVQTRTVTLALKPSDAEVLMVARSKGALSLSLRGVNDDEVLKHAPPPVAKVAAPTEPDPRWKIEEEKRQKLEQEVNNLKEMFARKAREVAPPASQVAKAPAVKPARFVWIYRAAKNQPDKIRMDEPGMTVLAGSSLLDGDLGAGQAARPFGIDPAQEAVPENEPQS